MKHVILNSPRLKELRRKKHKSAHRKIIIFSILILILILGFSFISKIPALNIDTIIISGNKVIETKDILSLTQNQIVGSYFFIFPKTNFLIYPQNKIKTVLKNNFKRIKDISVNNKKIKNIDILISEYEGKYLWCGVVVPILNNNNNQKCYFMDDNGYIFDEAPYFSGNVYFKFYGDNDLNKENPAGSFFMQGRFAKIIDFKNTIEKMDLGPNALWLDSDGEANFSISDEPMIGPRIIFKLDEDYQRLAENLQAAISIEPLRTDLKTKLSSLLYLDLRFGNKVYYKFQ